MGTNYYAIPIIDDETKRSVIDALNKNDFERARNLIPHRIHIGKSSIGWKFVFNHHDWVYFYSLESLKDFLSKCRIIDEYGRDISNEAFWKLVESKKDGINGYEYYSNYDKYNFGNKLDEMPTDVGDIEFFGLTFSTHTDFS